MTFLVGQNFVFDVKKQTVFSDQMDHNVHRHRLEAEGRVYDDGARFEKLGEERDRRSEIRSLPRAE